ncbi:MAG: protoheme farnesyltransferase [Geminicoccaceae bacterium]|nr:protoheme farnesyltransferase [Geminicoccaceae bacterium]
MTTPERVIGLDARIADASDVRDYWVLLKPNVMSLVVFSGAAGLYLAPGSLHPVLAFVAILCIAVASGAAAAINNGYDADIDAVMVRTRRRPTATGRISPDDALAFGVTLAIISVMVMGLAVNWVAAALLALTVAFYVFVYTLWLKRRTPQNIVIGGAAGAFPPMVGWAAVTGDVSLASIVLFLIIFVWTPPHFWALALYRCQDYARVGVPMLPVVAGPEKTRRHILGYAIALVAVSLLPFGLGLAGGLYGLAALALGAGFLGHAIRLWRDRSQRSATRTFRFSIVYLFALFFALVADKALGFAAGSGGGGAW